MSVDFYGVTILPGRAFKAPEPGMGRNAGLLSWGRQPAAPTTPRSFLEMGRDPARLHVQNHIGAPICISLGLWTTSVLAGDKL